MCTTHTALFRRSRVYALYPLVERARHVVDLDGQHDAADPSMLPDVDLLQDANWAWVHGTLSVREITSSSSTTCSTSRTSTTCTRSLRQKCDVPLRYQAKREGERVFAIYDRAEAPAGVFVHAIWRDGLPTVRVWARMRWDAPANLFLDIGFAQVNDPSEDGMRNPAYHFLTPETKTSTHYFWAVGRNMRQDDAELSEQHPQWCADDVRQRR